MMVFFFSFFNGKSRGVVPELLIGKRVFVFTFQRKIKRLTDEAKAVAYNYHFESDR
jgi:hypothetical protein